MSDLYVGVLLVIGAMTLIFFGPELWKTMLRKHRRAQRRLNRARLTLKKGSKVRTRRISVVSSFAH
jgi:hypothetical protein